MCLLYLNQMYYIFLKEKKRKKKAILHEVMTYENGGSIPTEVRNEL